MTPRAVTLCAAALLGVSIASAVGARPQYLNTFKAHYRTTMGKPTLNAANCAMCHIGPANQARWNPYGEAVRTALAGGRNVQDPAVITRALVAAERGTNATTRQTFGQMIAGDRLPAGNVAAAGGGTSGPGTGVVAPWEPGFNGLNMEGLVKMNQGNWVVEDGVLRYTGGGNGYVRTARQYTNYNAVIVWRYMDPGTGSNNDSGIFLKIRQDGNPWPNAPQLNMGPGQNFGSVGGTQGSRARFDLIRPNDWNTYQIAVRGNEVTVAINGVPAWDYAVGEGLTGPGYIGIQAENRRFEIAQFFIQPAQ